MIKPDEREILEAALRKWGVSQIGMLMEECGELLSAMNKYRRGRVNKEAVLEELVDVKVMCDQMIMFLGSVNEEDSMRTKKLKRLQERLEGY